jgi:hypothetical protein
MLSVSCGGGGSSGSSAPVIPNHLVFTTQPNDTVVDGPIQDFSVTVYDSNNNVVSLATNSIRITATGLTLGGTNPKSAVNGVATFTDLVAGGSVGTYTLYASGAGLTGGNSVSFTLTIATKSIVFSTQPSSTAVGAVAPTFIVTVKDAYGNTVTDANNLITIHAVGLTFATIGTDDCTFAVGGIARFDNLTIGGLAGSYTLIASAVGISIATSNSFNLTGFGAADHFIIAGSATMNAGASNALTITAKDVFGNTVTSYTGNHNLTFSGPSAIGAYTPSVSNYLAVDTAITGAAAINFAAGVATTNMKLYCAEAASIDVAAGAINATLHKLDCTVSALAASTLAFSAGNPPANIPVNTVSPFAVTVADTYGNTVVGGLGGTVVITGTPGTNTTYLGTLTKPIVNGVAVFTDFKISGTAITGQTLTATSTTLVKTQGFNLTFGPIDHFTVTGITDPVQGNVTVSPVVTAKDISNNTKTDYAGIIHFTSSDTNAAVVLPANYTFGAGTGTHTFTNEVKLQIPGVQSVTVADTVVTSATGSQSFTVAAYATAPAAIVLAKGSAAPVGAVTTVGFPAPGGTDTSGAVTGWITGTAEKIKFTVTPGTTGTSTINFSVLGAYTSGADYALPSAATLTIIVTTTEASKTTAVRTFTVTVEASAPVPTGMTLAVGSAQPVGGIVQVVAPLPGATDTTGAIGGWVTSSAEKIKFTVTNGAGAASVITINAGSYSSGDDYAIAAAGVVTIVVTTTKSGCTTAVRTFTMDCHAAAISAVATISAGTLKTVALVAGGGWAGGANPGASTATTVTIAGGADAALALTKGNAYSVITYVKTTGATPAVGDYATTYVSGNSIAGTIVTGDVIWLKVTAEDRTTILYYKITVTVS